MNTEESELITLVEEAKAGKREALEGLIRRIRDDVYRLALKMLWHPEDAQDATQEILIRILTHLDGFRGESAFTTWAFRVAANYLLTTRKRRAEREALSFEQFGKDLDEGRSAATPATSEAEQALLVEEVKIGCTQGLLLCLDREHRLAYILGEVFELTGAQGAALLDVTPAAFRKRLSRARARVRAFMARKCGLVNPDNPCRCRLRVQRAVEKGRVRPDHLLFARHPVRSPRTPALRKRVEEMETLHRAAAVFRSHPAFAAPEALLEGITALITSGAHPLLE